MLIGCSDSLIINQICKQSLSSLLQDLIDMNAFRVNKHQLALQTAASYNISMISSRFLATNWHLMKQCRCLKSKPRFKPFIEILKLFKFQQNLSAIHSNPLSINSVLIA